MKCARTTARTLFDLPCRRVPRVAATLTALVALALLVPGCDDTTTGRGVTLSRPGGGPLDADAMIADVEARALVGPRAARDLGLRVDWQAPGGGHALKIITEQGDSVFTLDEQNFLTRLRRDDGARIWRIPVAKPVEEVISVTYIEPAERIYVSTGGSMLVLDAPTGAQVGRQHIEKIANTAPAVAGQFMLYGSRNGQVIWHAFDIGYFWRAYEVSPSIKLAPVERNGVVVAVGTDGRIVALRVESATRIWDKRLLDNVVADPAIGDQAVFVAGLDQHVWALDLGNGRNIWRYLTESPLTEAPVLIRDRLYQQIPGEGLVCFDALPIEAPAGVVLWKAGQVRGNVLVSVGSSLLVWDRSGRAITSVDEATGAVVRSVPLEKVQQLRRADQRGRALLAASPDGMLVRLVPSG